MPLKDHCQLSLIFCDKVALKCVSDCPMLSPSSAKVRLQLQGKAIAGEGGKLAELKYRGAITLPFHPKQAPGCAINFV